MKCFKLSLFVLVPLLAQYATAIAVPKAALLARQQNKTGGGRGGNTGGNQAGNNGGNQAGNNGGATGGNNTAGGNAGDPQSSLTLDSSVIAPAFADGKGQAAGEADSLQSTNNFINFCIGKTITNGAQVTAGSCNPAPMGDLPSTANMPSCKFQNPKNGDTIASNTAFTVSMTIKGMQTGFFTNAAASYFSSPQQLNAQGQIKGHSHVVIEKLSSLDQTTAPDPTKFAFFKGLNAPDVKGVLTADVTDGLPAGFYKLSSINSAANHQPVLVPIAQHGSLDDAIYFTVSDKGAGGAVGNNAGNAGGAAGNPASSSVAADPATSTTATGGKGGKGGNNAGNPASSTVAADPATSSTATGGKGGFGKGGFGKGGSGKGGAQGRQQKRRFLADY